MNICSEYPFRKFFHNALVGFHLFGPDRIIMEMNDFELDLLGYDREEVVGKKTWSDLVVPAQIGEFEDHWAAILRGEEVRNLEYTLQRKNGGNVQVVLNASGNFDEKGNLINTWGIVVDVTEIDKYKTALQLSEERFRSMVDTAQEGIWVSDCEQVVRYVNDRMAAILGYRADEVVGKHVGEFAVDAGYLSSKNLPERRKRGVRERRFQRKDGTNAWVMESMSRFGEKKDDCGTLGMVTDMGPFMLQEHRQKLAVRILEKLNSAEENEDELIRQIFDLIQEFGNFDMVAMRSREENGSRLISDDKRVTSDCLCSSRSCGKLQAVHELFINPRTVYVNRCGGANCGNESVDGLFQCCQMFGFASVALIPLRSGRELLGFLQIADHRPELFTKEDVEFLEGIASSIGIALGRLRSHGELDRRNRELSRKNRELDRLNDELHKANVAKSEFVSVTSHELRTPLAEIIGFAQTLKTSGDKFDAEEKKRFLSIIEREGKRLGTLIDDLLDVTKFEVGAVKMDHACFDVVKLISEASEAVKMSFSADIDFGVSQNPVYLMGDRNRIKQVLINLMKNAVEHGGQTPVSISVEEHGSKVKVGVHDRGPGLETVDSQKLFGKFYKGKTSGGSGLGLSIAKEIVSAHKGRLWAQNREEKGASFYFTLPSCPNV